VPISVVSQDEEEAVENKIIWVLWDDGDFYGPDLQGIYSTEEAAKKAKKKLESGNYGFIGYISNYELDWER
jgi:hypothetical protein